MAKKVLLSVLFLLIVILATAGFGRSRFIAETDSSLELVSDGIDNVRKPSFIALKPMFSSDDTCDQTYGFLPCTSTIVGNLFLIIVYGFLMYQAAKLLSDGSELLLQIMGPGIIGGLFLPILGALPDAMLILVSGLSGTTETAQSQVLIGMGLLAGSTVMLLTLLWGSCVIVGKCDIEDSIARDSEDTKGLSLIESGVTTDIWTCYAARIMALSIIPFLVVQLPQFLHSNSERRLAILIALILSLALLVTYCLYQVFQPWIQKRRLAYAKHKHVISGILKHLKKHALGRLLTDEGYSRQSIWIQMGTCQVQSRVDEEEFLNGISRWIEVAKRSVVLTGNQGSHTTKVLDGFHHKIMKEHYLLGDVSDEAVEALKNTKRISIKAVLMLLLGTVIAAAFADPLVDAVDNFSTATSIPTFFISFIVLPFATNSSEAVSALIFASRKKQRSASLTFSEIYGAATMNNILCLAVFLALVYVRELTWDFSSEVLVIVIVCLVMGLFGSFRTTFPLWTCSVAYVLYPLSLVLVYILDYVLGLS
ncbi:sodium/calcium exchanger NCL-like isoform X2 [Macadamia integrifolia]|uniref:sodium/calcium exchanger NCL-like isoform X2 n=1 Tax=Macadamia integrifolia TaxID=60698 RepID=UPI001C4F3450|nr:sodium/calcium exchanger NCL-like isoform X2 [Macadamia integrifolia]